MAMSLIAILFDFIYSIRSSSDLIEVMNVGNEIIIHTAITVDRTGFINVDGIT